MIESVIKELPKTFTGKGEVSGDEFKQIRVTKSAFMYERTSGDRKLYEVFKRVVNHRFGTVSYPRSKSFGKWAWTYSSLVKANMKFNEIND